MKNEKLGKVKYWLEIAALGVVLGLVIQGAQAWVGPPANPPSANVGAPLNTGLNPQAKQGPLELFWQNWDPATNQGENPDLVALLAAGEVRADDFCLNSDLTKCLSNAGGVPRGDMIKVDGNNATCPADHPIPLAKNWNTRWCGDSGSSCTTPSGWHGAAQGPQCEYQGKCTWGEPSYCPTPHACIANGWSSVICVSF